MSPDIFGAINSPLGSTIGRGVTKTPGQIIQEQLEAQGIWDASPLGQKYNQAQESATAYARKQADQAMEIAKRRLDAEVANLERQGRLAEAQERRQQGEMQLAQQRFAWEQEIKQQELGLQQQAQDLEYAKAYTQYASGPDTLFMMGDFQDALARAGNGLAPRPYGATGTPTPRTFEDFQAIAGPGGGASGSGQGSGGKDPRVAAATGILKALPPSPGDGHDASDQAALAAIENVFRARLPGTYEKFRPGQQKAFGAGLSRLGYYAPDALAEMRRAGVGQGSVRAA